MSRIYNVPISADRLKLRDMDNLTYYEDKTKEMQSSEILQLDCAKNMEDIDFSCLRSLWMSLLPYTT